MEKQDMIRRAKDWYNEISVNTILNSSISRKYDNTVSLKVQSPDKSFIGYIWVRFIFFKHEIQMALCSEYVCHTVKHIKI